MVRRRTEVDEVNIDYVTFIEAKIELTMTRINSLKKWECKFELCRLKNYMLVKLRHQLDFLLRVQKVKHANAR